MGKTEWQLPSSALRIATTTEIGRKLGVDRALANRLIRAGLVGRQFSLDEELTKLAGERSELDRLTLRRVLDPDNQNLPSAVLVRVGDPQPETGSGRSWTGWHQSMPDEVAEEATSKWWPLSKPHHEEALGKLLVVSLASVIVRVRRIMEVREAPGLVRVAFVTEKAVGDDAEVYLDQRIATRRGPVASPINMGLHK